LEIGRERVGINNPIDSKSAKDIKIIIKFAKERAKIDIYDLNEKIWIVPSNNSNLFLWSLSY
jgi:hypothetical protein